MIWQYISLLNQVVSLEYAKRLKELKVPQKNGLYCWVKNRFGDFYVTSEGITPMITSDDENCMAFTVAELGEMLPARIRNKKTGNLDFLRMHKGDDYKQDVRDKFTLEYHTTFYAPLCRISSNSEADARAKMLIYLIENHLYRPV